MAEQMSAREAWETVRDVADGSGSAIKRADSRYARACAIVEAAVHAHEKLDALHFMAYPDWSSKQHASIAWFKAFENVRALERGEAGE